MIAPNPDIDFFEDDAHSPNPTGNPDILKLNLEAANLFAQLASMLPAVTNALSSAESPHLTSQETTSLKAHIQAHLADHLGVDMTLVDIDTLLIELIKVTQYEYISLQDFLNRKFEALNNNALQAMTTQTRDIQRHEASCTNINVALSTTLFGTGMVLANAPDIVALSALLIPVTAQIIEQGIRLGKETPDLAALTSQLRSTAQIPESTINTVRRRITHLSGWSGIRSVLGSLLAVNIGIAVNKVLLQDHPLEYPLTLFTIGMGQVLSSVSNYFFARASLRKTAQLVENVLQS